jgi:NADH-quinone oxidoreductase subunit C
MNAESLIQAVRDRFPLEAAHAYRGDATVVAGRETLLPLAKVLQEDPAFQMNLLVDITAVDYLAFGKSPRRAFFASSGIGVRPSMEIPAEEPWPGPPSSARFAVVYHFLSLPHKHRLRVEVPVDGESPEVDSLSPLWGNANWLEREVWDMFGIRFKGHPDLKRILMYEEFEGHALRKDYPVKKRQPLIGPVN